MKKTHAMMLFSCAMILASCHFAKTSSSQSSTEDPSQEEYVFTENISYRDNNVIFTFPKGTKEIKVYSSDRKGGTYKETAVLENEDSYYIDDALSYYRFEVTDGQTKTTYGPYSYLKDFFQNDYVHVYSPSDDIKKIQEEFDLAYSRFNTFSYQFSDERFAALFLKGDYPDLDCPLGYYSTLQGLDENPDNVSISTVYRES